MNETDTSSSIEIDITREKRYYWIDHARGFIMLLLVLTEFLPMFIRDAARFFLEHPINQRTAEYMNFYDIGAPAFIVIMGFLMPLSFFRRKEKDGTGKAVRHMIIRYGIILLLGYLVILIDQQAIVKTVDGMIIVIWDVLPSLGLVGLIAIPFLFVNPKIRAILASVLLIFYQLMLFFGGWREYAIESVHGGIFGTIFGFSAIMIYATCLGELFFIDKETPERKKYQIYAIVGIIAFLGGILIALIPGWYANKRQVTLTYILISLGTSILLSFIFIAIDKKYNKPIIILDSYGKNPFLIYIIAIVLEFLLSDILEFEKDLILFVIMTVIITIIAIVLDKWGRIIKL